MQYWCLRYLNLRNHQSDGHEMVEFLVKNGAHGFRAVNRQSNVLQNLNEVRTSNSGNGVSCVAEGEQEIRRLIKGNTLAKNLPTPVKKMGAYRAHIH